MRALEEAWLVLCTVFPEVPPRVECRLTDDGLRLLPVVEVMRKFCLWLKSRGGSE
ncbi:winged helix-turn-helix transcriptional regulator [Paraburkholderia eburnea]|uniref:winged helix-turn-helix transcriptional regulator n=1 Tax=Paraburkholderia eburnea TaxID=1189126 RepID=UPI003898F0BE